MTQADHNDMTLVGRCGLYCGACGIYRAQRDSIEMAEKIAKSFNCPAEKIKCGGCGNLKEECWSNDCGLVLCLNEKGYQYCHECSEFENDTCKLYKELADRYMNEANIDLRKSLAVIKEGDVRNWLQQMKDKYTCPHCGNPTIAARPTCHHCSAELTSE